jgi:hypothetical protein
MVAAERVWLGVALAFALLCAARSMAPALASGEVVQDDARQHVFWMLRFRDPELFAGDLIADYYQALAPPGYRALYWAMSPVVDPLTASKLLPPLVGSVAALFTFLFARQLHPSPVAAFLASALVSWYVWQYDDLASATPRAFLLPVLSAQLWALAASRVWLGAGLAVLSAALYPVAGALAVALLAARLVGWRDGRPRLSRETSDRVALPVGGLLAGAMLLSTQQTAAPFGPVLSAAEARMMPDLGVHGRLAFFVDDPAQYWLAGQYSGLDLRVRDERFPSVPMLAEYAALASLLPLLLVLTQSLPAVQQLGSRGLLLVHVLVVSFGLFGVSHLLLFHLYIPSRYVKWSVPLALAVAAGLALGILVETLAGRVGGNRRQVVGAGLALGLALGLASYPARYNANFKDDPHPSVTEYLRAQPKDVLVAGVPLETDSVGIFAQRRVLTNREHFYPWYLGYYNELRRRMEDLIDAYYAATPAEVAEFAARHKVDILLVNRAAFDPQRFWGVWSGSFRGRWEPFTTTIHERLASGERFALLELAQRCATVDDGVVAVVSTSCVRETT